MPQGVCFWSWRQRRAPESLQIHKEYELRHSVLLVPLHARCMAGEGGSCHNGFMMPTLALKTPSQGRFIEQLPGALKQC